MEAPAPLPSILPSKCSWGNPVLVAPILVALSSSLLGPGARTASGLPSYGEDVNGTSCIVRFMRLSVGSAALILPSLSMYVC